MEISSIITAGLVICFAAAAQSAVGFGYALFATPLLAWAGMPLPSVIALVAACSMFQAIIGSHSLRAMAPWRQAFAAAAVRVASMVAGLILLKRLVGLDTAHIRAVIGAVLCLLVAVQMLWNPSQSGRMHWGWGGFAFLASGLLAGVCGMGGPPLVLWAMAHDWSNQKTRGFLFAVFAASIPVQIVLLSLAFGPAILWNVALGIAFLPLVYIGSVLGLRAGNRIEKAVLKRLAYGILMAIGVSAVVPVLLSSLN